MTPEPPSSSDGSSLPQRHRLALENLVKDTTELELWDLENDLEMSDEAAESQGDKPPRAFTGDIPAPRGSRAGKTLSPETPAAAGADSGEEFIRMHVNRKRLKKDSREVSVKSPAYESEFADLEGWQDSRNEPEPENLPAEEECEVAAAEDEVAIEEAKVTEEPAPVVSAPVVEAPAPVPPVEDDDDGEFSPAKGEDAGSVSLRPHLGLSKIERIGLIALLVVLVGGGASIFLWSLNRLPMESVKAESADFPIKGERVTITSAKSYWRAPIVDGPDADTFRRGTELLPVLELEVSGGPASIRIFFRDEMGATIGDALSRSINGEGVLKIPATAGFDDPGMHAAYRTGESKPWTVQVWEVSSGSASDGNSKKLFEMNVSTDRR